MSSNGNKKHGRTKKSASQIRYTQARRWETNKASRIAKEKARQSACKAVRSAFVKTKEVPRLKDISRRVRKAA